LGQIYSTAMWPHRANRVELLYRAFTQVKSHGSQQSLPRVQQSRTLSGILRCLSAQAGARGQHRKVHACMFVLLEPN
jgi:hypothetical protein